MKAARASEPPAMLLLRAEQAWTLPGCRSPADCGAGAVPVAAAQAGVVFAAPQAAEPPLPQLCPGVPRCLAAAAAGSGGRAPRTCLVFQLSIQARASFTFSATAWAAGVKEATRAGPTDTGGE